MATTFRASSKNNSTTGTAMSVSAPTGTTTGDFVVCIIHGNGQTTIADNNGATPFTADVSNYKPNTTGGHTLSIYSRTIVGGDPSTYNFTLGSSNRWSIQAITFQNPNASSKYDVSPSTGNIANVDNSSSGTLDAPTITTNSANAIHVVFEVVDTAATSAFTTPSGYTALETVASEPQFAAYKVIPTASATGAVTMIAVEFGTRMSGSFAVKDIGTSVASSRKLPLLGVG